MKISRLQLFWIFFSYLIGNLLLLTISPTTTVALQDSWISFILATLFGLLVILIVAKVNHFYPNLMFFELTKKIVGKWLGVVIFFFYLVSWYAVLGNLLAEFADFTIKILLPTTPIWVMVLTMLLLAIYVTFIGGIEGIGRCAEVFGPIIVLCLVILILLSLQNIELNKAMPIFADNGLFPILKASLYPFSLFGEGVLLLMLLPFADQPKIGAIRAAWGLAVSGLLSSITAFFVIMTFGPNVSAKSQYPAFDMFSYINFMDFIQNLKIVAVLLWIISIFIKISLYFFLASYGTSQLLKLKDWKKSIWFLAAVSFIMALVIKNFNIQGRTFLEMYWLPFVLPLNMIGIPLLLLIVGGIRKSKKKATKKQDNTS